MSTTSSIRYVSIALSLTLTIVLIVLILRLNTPEASITPISSDNFYLPKDSIYLQYLEPVANQTINNDPPEWLSYRPIFYINSDGLHERFEYTERVPERTLRIATLGDSWTFGQFVNTKDNFSEVLEDLLNTKLLCPNWDSFEVINLGSPSYDVQFAVERFRLKGQKYNPALVVWLLIENDFDEIAEEVNTYMKTLLPADTPAEVNRMSPNSTFDAFLTAKKHLEDTYTVEQLIEFQETALRSIRSYYSNDLLLYTIPDGSGIDHDFKPILQRMATEDPKTEWFKSSLSLRMYNRSLPDQHPSSKGHQAIAENLFHYITSKYIPDCSLIR